MLDIMQSRSVCGALHQCTPLISSPSIYVVRTHIIGFVCVCTIVRGTHARKKIPIPIHTQCQCRLSDRHFIFFLSTGTGSALSEVANNRRVKGPATLELTAFDYISGPGDLSKAMDCNQAFMEGIEFRWVLYYTAHRYPTRTLFTERIFHPKRGTVVLGHGIHYNVLTIGYGVPRILVAGR